jgi:hypothetical protein
LGTNARERCILLEGDRIHFCEDGVKRINLPIASQVIGDRSTWTTTRSRWSASPSLPSGHFTKPTSTIAFCSQVSASGAPMVHWDESLHSTPMWPAWLQTISCKLA